MDESERLLQAVKEYRSGNEEAFSVMYEEGSKYLYVCIRKVIGGNDNAQDIIRDIMQDTWLEVVRSIKNLDKDESFLFWAGRIATNKCHAYIKKNKKYVLLEEDDTTLEQLSDSDEIIPESVMQNKELQRLLREIIDTRLTEMQRLCIVAYFYNRQKQSEIAKDLGIPENTVKTHLARGKAKIEEGIKEIEKDNYTRLHSIAPFFLLLLQEDIRNAVIPAELTEGIFRVTGMSMSAGIAEGAAAATEAAVAGTAAAETAASEAVVQKVAEKGIKGLLKKVASASVKAKIMTCVAVLGIAGIAGGVFLYAEAEEQRQEAEYRKEQDKEEKQEAEYREERNKEEKQEMESQSDEAEEPENDREEAAWTKYYQSILTNMTSRSPSKVDTFDLYDFDQDGIPEIIFLDSEEKTQGSVAKYIPETKQLEYFSYDLRSTIFSMYSVEEIKYSLGYIGNYIIKIEQADYVMEEGYEDAKERYITFYEVDENDMQPTVSIQWGSWTGRLEDANDYGISYQNGKERIGTSMKYGEVMEIIELVEEQMQPFSYTTDGESEVAARIEEFQNHGAYKEPGALIELIVGGGDDAVIKTIEVTVTGTEPPTWQQAYRQFLLDSVDIYAAFDLHDFDANGTPELICSNSGNVKDIYTYYDGKIREVQMHVVRTDGNRTLAYGDESNDLYEIYEVWVSDGNGRTLEAELVRFYFTYSVETDSCMFVPYEEYIDTAQVANFEFGIVRNGEPIDKELFLENHEKATYTKIYSSDITKEFEAYEKGN